MKNIIKLFDTLKEVLESEELENLSIDREQIKKSKVYWHSEEYDNVYTVTLKIKEK